MDYWRDYPPTHILVAAYLTGGKKGPTSRAKKAGNSYPDDLVQAVALAGGGARHKLPSVYKSESIA